MIARALLALIMMTGTALGVPQIVSPVNDSNGYISAAEQAEIAQALSAHRTRTGVHIAVLLVDTLNGVPIEDYSLKVASDWGGGSKAKSDGVLFVLAVKDRRMRIEVGYGLEPALPDARAAQILSRLKPSLRAKEYGAAVKTAVLAIIRHTKNLDPDQVAQGLTAPAKHDSTYSMGSVILIIISVFLTIGVTRRLKEFRHQAGVYLGAMAVAAIVMGSTGLGWALVLFAHLLLAQFILRTFMPSALNLTTEEDPESVTSGPKFYRGFLLISWFMVPIICMEDPDFESATTAAVASSLAVQTVMTVLFTALFGTVFHVVRAITVSGFGGGSGGTAPSHWHTTTHTTFDNSSWTSSTDWSSSNDSWSGSDFDWGGGGGGFGGGGASDSW